MTTAIRTNQIQDEFQRPVPGASVYAYNQDGTLASLTSDGSTSIANPLTTDAFGNYQYYALVGYYREDIWFGGRLRWSENNVAVGSPGADLTLRSDLAADTGSTLILHKSSGANTFGRTLRQWASVGGLSDNSIFNWIDSNYDPAILSSSPTGPDLNSAFTAALSYIAGSGSPVMFPVTGLYRTDPFQIAPQVYADQGFFQGIEAASTVIQRYTTGATPFITIGESNGTIFQAGLIFQGLTVDGGAASNGEACVLYDVVRSRFEAVNFSGGAKALHSYGGIALSFDDCMFQNAARGFVAEHFASSAGAGYPNSIRLKNCDFSNNSEWGGWVDHARVISLTGSRVEANGTTLGSAQGGFYVGPNMGDEVSINDTESLGIRIETTWFEANLGIADVHLNSGLNSIEFANFFSTSIQTTSDIKIDGGRYAVRSCNSSFAKTANLLEGGSVGTGNVVELVEMANLSYDPTKTTVRSTTSMNLAGNLALFPAASAVPGTNGQMTWQLTNNTTLVIKVKGSDGTVRSTTLTLA